MLEAQVWSLKPLGSPETLLGGGSLQAPHIVGPLPNFRTNKQTNWIILTSFGTYRWAFLLLFLMSWRLKHLKMQIPHPWKCVLCNTYTFFFFFLKSVVGAGEMVVARELALHVASLNLIPSIPFGTLSTTRNHLWVLNQELSPVIAGYGSKQKCCRLVPLACASHLLGRLRQELSSGVLDLNVLCW